MPNAVYVLIGMAVMALPCLLLLWLVRRKTSDARAVAEAEGRLSESLRSAHADLAARVERFQGSLRAEWEEKFRRDLGGLEARTSSQLEAVRADVEGQLRRWGDQICANLKTTDDHLRQAQRSWELVQARLEEGTARPRDDRSAAQEPPAPEPPPPAGL